MINIRTSGRRSQTSDNSSGVFEVRNQRSVYRKHSLLIPCRVVPFSKHIHPETMSIIEKTNPLNLQFCVCVVLNSSCPLGIIISKTLLKANALVLGIDSRPKDDSLNAGLGTHFQYEQKAPEDVSSEQVMKIVQERYDQERMDVMVNVVEAGQEGRLQDAVNLTEGLAKVIAEGGRGKGAVITVMSDAEDAEAAQVKQAVSCSR